MSFQPNHTAPLRRDITNEGNKMHEDWRECPLLINTLNGLAADLCNGMPARIGGKTLVTVSQLELALERRALDAYDDPSQLGRVALGELLRCALNYDSAGAYGAARQMVGKGYATEAAEALLEPFAREIMDLLVREADYV